MRPQNRKIIVIIGNSLVNNEARSIQKEHAHQVTVRRHPGATTRDMLDRVRPEVKEKSDQIILLQGQMI